MSEKCYHNYINQKGKEGKSMNVPERIQELRKQKGISQEELANELGVSRQAVSKWESGQSFPELDNIVALSDYFGVSADHILKGTEPPQEPVKQTVAALKPKRSIDDMMKLLIQKKNDADEREEKEVIIKVVIALTQKQKSALAMTLFVCSAAISIIAAYALGVFFDSSSSYNWVASLGVMLIGFGLYYVGKRLSLKEPPFIVRYINKASFVFAIAFLTAIHSAFNNMDYRHDDRIGFAVIYILGAAIVYAGIMLYRKIKRLQSEMYPDNDLTQQSTK